MNLHDRLRGNKGFTLIELLVVIAIIAILAGILFPVLLTAKKSAVRATCTSNMKQLNQAFALYRGDYDGWYPLGGFKFASGDYSNEWQNVVWKYVKKDKAFRCPGSPCADMDWNHPNSVGTRSDLPLTPITYLYNNALGTDMYSASAAQQNPKAHRETEVIAPIRCILLMEGNKGVPQSTFKGVDAHHRTNTLWLSDYTFYMIADFITGGDAPRKSMRLPNHPSGGNVTFCDGHVQFYKFDSKRTIQEALPWLVHVPLCSTQVSMKVDDAPWQ